ncbi:MAG: PilN domain-containing protein [Phycisphaerales bacterium]
MSFLLTGNQNENAGVNNASFLPADYIQRKAEVRNNLIVLSLFALVMMGVGGAFYMTNKAKVNLGQEFVSLREQCEAESKQIEALKKLQEQRAVMMEKAEITAALLEPVPRWAVLSELRYRMPETVRLDSFEMKGNRNGGGGGGINMPKIKTLVDSTAGVAPDARPKIVAPSFTYEVVINGAAEENNDVADYLTSLKSSPLLKDVELTFIKEQKENKKILRKFEITATLKSEVDREKLGESIRTLIAKKTGKTPEQLATPNATPETGTPKAEATPQVENTQVTEAKEGL